jgi:hypothetical protein
MAMIRHGAILNKIGGRTCLANVLGLKPETVKSWYKRGIPAKYWHRIAALKPGLTIEYLEKTKPSNGRAP